MTILKSEWTSLLPCQPQRLEEPKSNCFCPQSGSIAVRKLLAWTRCQLQEPHMEWTVWNLICPTLWDVHLVVSRNLFKNGDARNPTCFEPTDFMHMHTDTHVTENTQHLVDGCKWHWLFWMVKRLDNVLCELLTVSLLKNIIHIWIIHLFSCCSLSLQLLQDFLTWAAKD